MRIDKTINRITKKIFSWKLIEDFLFWSNISYKFKLLAFFISLKKNLLLIKRWWFTGLRNQENIGWYNIGKESFDFNNKKLGITALGRFKNSEDFLEICIKSILPYVEEVIMLVDVSSVDQTENICKKLAKDYPLQCKYYEYEYDVYPWNHPKYAVVSDDSIHALSYFYNYCMSKASYKYVMKFDDDMLCIGQQFGNICDAIRKDWLNHFLDIPQINISRDNNWRFAVANKYLSSWIAGVFWDHGIFPLSRNTYFFNDVGCENIIAPYSIKYANYIWFLHLKNLKKWGGMKNYQWYWLEFIKQLNDWTWYIKLPQKYKNILTKRGIE